jgi:molecular chaperone GrpE
METNETTDQILQNGKNGYQSLTDETSFVPPTESGTVNQDPLIEKLKETEDKYVRLYADFDNYKKRAIKEKLDVRNDVYSHLLSGIFDLFDDFSLAKENIDKVADDNTKASIGLIFAKIDSYLQFNGITRIDTSGEFNPELHECISTIPTDDNKNKIIATTKQGYMFGDKILRHSKVVVNI